MTERKRKAAQEKSMERRLENRGSEKAERTGGLTGRREGQERERPDRNQLQNRNQRTEKLED